MFIMYANKGFEIEFEFLKKRLEAATLCATTWKCLKIVAHVFPIMNIS